MSYDKRLRGDNWYNYPNGDKYKLMFDNYHYQDSLNNNDIMYQSYNKNPKSFSDFYYEYFLFKDVFADIVENCESLDMRILIKLFTDTKIIMYIFGPYVEAAAKVTLLIDNHTIDAKYRFNLILEINNINDSKEVKDIERPEIKDVFIKYINIINGENDVVRDYFPNSKSIYATKGYLK